MQVAFEEKIKITLKLQLKPFRSPKTPEVFPCTTLISLSIICWTHIQPYFLTALVLFSVQSALIQCTCTLPNGQLINIWFHPSFALALCLIYWALLKPAKVWRQKCIEFFQVLVTTVTEDYTNMKGIVFRRRGEVRCHTDFHLQLRNWDTENRRLIKNKWIQCLIWQPRC